METKPRRPIWQPSRRTRFKAFLSEILKKITWTQLAITLLALPLIFYVYREVTRDALIFDAFTVPKNFEEAGLTSDVMANRIGENLNQIEEATRIRLKKDNLSSFRDEGSIPEVDIPGTSLGLKTVIDLTRTIFGVYPKHISGDVVMLANDSANTKPPATAKQQATVTIYVTQGRKRSAAVSVTSDAGDVGMLVQRAAETVLGQVNPYLFASYRYDHKEYEKALEIIEEKFADPSQTRSQKVFALIIWGRVLQDQEKPDEAIAKYRKAIEIYPKLAVAYNNWGSVLQAQNKYGEAVAKYQKSIELEPKFAPAYNNLGMALLSQNMYDEAVVKFRQAANLDPKLAGTHYNWDTALLSQNKYDDAIAQFEQETALNPKFAKAYSNGGMALLSQNKYDEAIAKFQKATNVDPKLAAAYNDWGYALYSQGKFKEAIAKYQKATVADPSLAPAYNSWGNALYAQNQFDEAIVQYEKATNVDPKFAVAYNNWGKALKSEGKDVQAASRFNIADALSHAQSK